MRNIDLRIRISEAGLKFKDIAQALEITPEYFSRLMAKPLSKKHREQVETAIAILERGKEGATHEQNDSL